MVAFGRDAAGGTEDEDDAVGNVAVRSGAPHLDCLDCWLLMLVYSFYHRDVITELSERGAISRSAEERA